VLFATTVDVVYAKELQGIFSTAGTLRIGPAVMSEHFPFYSSMAFVLSPVLNGGPSYIIGVVPSP
jgi:hypothetical protein